MTWWWPIFRTETSRQVMYYSWFQTFAMLWMLYAFFWVIPRRLNSDAWELPRRKHTTSNILHAIVNTNILWLIHQRECFIYKKKSNFILILGLWRCSVHWWAFWDLCWGSVRCICSLPFQVSLISNKKYESCFRPTCRQYQCVWVK
jgi:hypothetical protein